MARSHLNSLKAEYIGADQLPLFVFRLQLCGGPYIPITPPFIIRSYPHQDTIEANRYFLRLTHLGCRTIVEIVVRVA